MCCVFLTYLLYCDVGVALPTLSDVIKKQTDKRGRAHNHWQKWRR